MMGVELHVELDTWARKRFVILKLVNIYMTK